MRNLARKFFTVLLYPILRPLGMVVTTYENLARIRILEIQLETLDTDFDVLVSKYKKDSVGGVLGEDFLVYFEQQGVSREDMIDTIKNSVNFYVWKQSMEDQGYLYPETYDELEEYTKFSL